MDTLLHIVCPLLDVALRLLDARDLADLWRQLWELRGLVGVFALGIAGVPIVGIIAQS